MEHWWCEDVDGFQCTTNKLEDVAMVHCFNGLLVACKIEFLADYCEDEVKLTVFFRVINRIK